MILLTKLRQTPIHRQQYKQRLAFQSPKLRLQIRLHLFIHSLILPSMSSSMPNTFRVVLCFCLFSVTHVANAKLTENYNQQIEQIRQSSHQAIADKQQNLIEQSEQHHNKQKNQLNTESEQVPKNQEISLEVAIFLAINHSDWVALANLLQVAKKQSNTQPIVDSNVLAFAKASLSRGKGNIANAINQYEQLLHKQPDFVRARLDLARIYYQDNQLKEAKQQFHQLKKLNNLPKNVQRNIDGYLTAIANKESINTTLAFGLGYETNINQSSESTVLLSSSSNGFNLYGRTPKALNSNALNIEGTLHKNWQLKGHHNITTDMLAYTNNYTRKQLEEYNNTTLNINLGYTYKDHNTKLSVTPSFEYRRENRKKLYQATGARLNFQQRFSSMGYPSRLNIALDHKKYSYTPVYNSNDGTQLTASTEFFVNTAANKQWFASFSHTKRNSAFKTNSYKQNAIGLGQGYQWQSGFISTVYLQQNWRKYRAFNAYLRKQRNDSQITTNLNLRAPQFKIKGFVPSVNYRYHHNDSNADSTYDYDTHTVNLKFFKVF